LNYFDLIFIAILIATDIFYSKNGFFFPLKLYFFLGTISKVVLPLQIYNWIDKSPLLEQKSSFQG